MRKGGEQNRPVSGSSQLSNTAPVQIASARLFGSRKWRILQTTCMRPVVLCFFVLLLSLPVHATIAHAADGREIAANGNGSGAPACSVCHGAQGQGQPDVAYPRLAGLDSTYLIEQLNAFADGSRGNETMPPIAKALTPDERQAIAKFYAGLVAPKMEEPQKADDKSIAAGAALAGRGDWSKGLPGCGQCHGAAGQGVGKTFPALAGQSAEYIMSQLKAWKDGKRTNDPLHLMTGISSRLSDDQIAAVAAYYASLPVATLAAAKPLGPKP
jgi:cytochrome c553